MRYPAIVVREGSVWLIEFPDCPGCQTFARAAAEIEPRATEALEAWLETVLEGGQVPPPPRRRHAPKGGELRQVTVPAGLSAAITIRRARAEAKLSQAALGQRIGVSQQAIAKLERSGGNVSIETLEKVARGLGRSVEIELVS
ncbi:MAG: helix-turn-helix domain-containing protein [Gemmatimonadales bacterium]